MLVRLVYASRAGQSLPTQDVATLLRDAREKNARNGISGLLFVNDGMFIQVLEGGRLAVNTLYRRILQDARHHDVVLLSYEEITERHFAGWAMGQVNKQRLNPGLVLKYSATPRLDPYAMSGATLMRLFDELISSGAIECS